MCDRPPPILIQEDDEDSEAAHAPPRSDIASKDVRDVYAFEHKIGAGAFGQVRRARNLKSGASVAIKIILKCEQGVTYEELMEEVCCMKRLDGGACKNVIHLADTYYVDQRRLFLPTTWTTTSGFSDNSCS